MNILVNPAQIADLAPPPNNDGASYEMIDGQWVEMPPMSTLALVVANRLSFKLELTGERSGVGHAYTEMRFRLPLPENRVRQPDVAFVSFERWAKDRPFGTENGWEVAPNLAVEVISPSDFAEDLIVKLDEYFRCGVRLVWVVYPQQALVYVYESLTQVRGLGRQHVLDGGAVLPDFRLALTDLFASA